MTEAERRQVEALHHELRRGRVSAYDRYLGPSTVEIHDLYDTLVKVGLLPTKGGRT